jgi:hypothetical protein
MTEQEWLESNAGWMLHHIEQRYAPSPRKLRLLAAVYAGFLQTQPEYADSKHVAHLGEDVADGVQTLEDLWNDRVRGWGCAGDWSIANLVLAPDRIGNKIRLHISGLFKSESESQAAYTDCHLAAIRPYLLCIFGNPFRPVTLDPAWRTSDVLALARGIYEERAFDRMPILADALQDAGCDNDDILSHCRDTATPHARGCWVVDLVLGKE